MRFQRESTVSEEYSALSYPRARKTSC
jgi:hypothetical protein